MRTESSTEENNAFGIKCVAPWRLTKVTPIPNYTLKVEFFDGTHGTVEMSRLIMGNNNGVFKALKEINLFNQVYLAYGVVTWPGEIDLAPDAMYTEIKETGTWILQ
jgi:hypothetical protein